MKDSLVKKIISAAARCEEDAVNFPYPRDINSPLSIMLSNFDDRIDARMDLALVSDGDPEIFLLEIGSRFVVVVNTAYLGVVNGLVAAFFGSIPISDAGLYTKTKLGLCINLVQDFIPADIFSKAVKSRIEENVKKQRQQMSVFMTFPSTPADIEMLDYNEFYLALWFFFVAHEIGHCLRRTKSHGKIIYGDLEDLVISSESGARAHIGRIREVGGDVTELEGLLEVDDSESLVDEIFCDQAAFVMVMEMVSVMKEKEFGDLSDSGYLVSSIFNVFVAHQKLLELRRLRHRIGLLGRDGFDGYRADKKRNAIRFAYLRDVVACLVPCGSDLSKFRGSQGFSIFGHYGLSGIREMAANARSIKELEFDPLMDLALKTVFEDCFSRPVSELA